MSERILVALQAVPVDAPAIPPETLGDFANTTLYRYRAGDETVLVSAEQFRQKFNNLFVRQMPVRPALLRTLIEDLAVAEIDIAAARLAGIDATPQFVQDRHGFRAMQILDFYEREVLSPGLHAEGTEIEACYRQHQAQFVQPVLVRGRLLLFEDQHHLAGWHETPSANPPTQELTMEYKTAGEPPKGFEAFRPALLHASPETVIGPVPRGGGFAVFVKDTQDVAPLPLSAVRPVVERMVLQQKLHAKERELASEWAVNFSIRDNIDYERYGLTAAEVSRPWRHEN